LPPDVSLEVKVPVGMAPVVVQKKPDVVEIIPVPRKIVKKMGWWKYLFGEW
jgi:hypothetical protein